MNWQGVTERRIETNHITLNIAEVGEGPLLLLLHGFPERCRTAPLAAAG